MDRPIDRIEPERVLPTGRPQNNKPHDGDAKFSLSKEEEAKDEAQEERLHQDRTVGPRDEDEAGGQLDLTA